MPARHGVLQGRREQAVGPGRGQLADRGDRRESERPALHPVRAGRGPRKAAAEGLRGRGERRRRQRQEVGAGGAAALELLRAAGREGAMAKRTGFRDEVAQHFRELRDRIVARLSALDGGSFSRKEWARPEGGGGEMSEIRSGLFEKGGCN